MPLGPAALNFLVGPWLLPNSGYGILWPVRREPRGLGVSLGPMSARVFVALVCAGLGASVWIYVQIQAMFYPFQIPLAPAARKSLWKLLPE